MTERRYYCVNRVLYVCMSLIVLGICIYTLLGKDWAAVIAQPLEYYQVYLAILGGLAVSLWGAYFALMFYEVNEQGVRRGGICPYFFKWDELQSIDVEQMDTGGQAQCKLLFITKTQGTRSISSELLSLEDMEELLRDLRAWGCLPFSCPAEEEEEEES